MPPVQRIKAYAKINLFLEITNRRPDGYHTLSTIFQTISLADDLTLESADTLRLRCSDASLPTDESNLVMRAAMRLRDRLGESKGAAIYLQKNVPMGAGLGGGSGDAGALLAALPQWWKRQPSRTLLHQCAVKVGADVPFFLTGGTCSAGGIGDRLRPLPRLAKTWLVLVYPGFGVSTKEAYSKVKVAMKGKKSVQKMIPLLTRPNPAAWAGHLFNRFEEFVFPDHPELPRLKQDLLDAGAVGALMSGSGSSVFGIMPNEAQGKKALAALSTKYPQSWLVHTV